MKTKSQSRSRCAIEAGRWASYALAGAATAMAASNDADAVIYYSGTIDKTVSTGQVFQATTLHTHGRGFPPFPGSDAIAAFEVISPLSRDFAEMYGGHAVGQKYAGGGYASRLAGGVNVSAQHFTSNTVQFHAVKFQSRVAGHSQWKNFSGTAFMGFEFKNGGGNTVYGWARITMNGTYTSYIIDDYAFGSTGQPIATGEEAVLTNFWTGGANSTVWATPGNWNGAIPGATGGSTTNTDSATFNAYNANYPTPVVDAGRNLQNIFFDNSSGTLTNSLTLGTTSGNPLLLTTSGVIETTSTVANPQFVNAPLVLEGTGGMYTFLSNSATASSTLNFGGPITAGAGSGTTTLTLQGTNTGANTISGVIANGTSGATLALSMANGSWVLAGANTYTGATTVSGGTLTVGNGTSGSLGATPISITGGRLALAAGGSIGNTSISVSSAGTFAVLPGAGALSAGSNASGTSGATLSVGSGATFTMVDGAIGTFNLLQQSNFTANPALTLSGGTLNFDLSSGGADELTLGVGLASVSGTNRIGITPVGTSLGSGTYPLISAPAGGLSGTFQFANGGVAEYAVAGGNYYQLTLSNTGTAESISVAPNYTNFIILDTFTGTSGTSIASHSPDVNKPTPGGTYTVWGSTGHAQLFGGGQVEIGADIGAAASINSAGSYMKPSTMTISAGVQIGSTSGSDLGTGEAYRGVGLGFYPSAPPGANAFSSFNGLVLNTDGSLALANTSGQTESSLVSVPWPTATLGTFSASATYNISYTINTAAGGGGISNVSVSNGSVTDTMDFTAIDNYNGANIFTAGATSFAGFMDSSASPSTFGYVSSFALIGTGTSGASVWTGTNGTSSWADSGNWQNGLVPGSTTGTNDTSTALFNLNTTTSPLTIDVGRNVMNITFDASAVSSNTIGMTGGSALLLSSGGTIQTTPTVVNPQLVNAPLVLEGNYAFASGATASGATLSFGGGITPAASSGTTTLTLNGSNTGANTISGVLADHGAGRLALAVGGIGVWVLDGSTSTYSGGTTIASGATLQLAGSVSALGSSQNIANSGSLVAAGGNQTVGTVLGTGSVAVTSGSLTAYQIRQNSLTIGSGALVTLLPSGSGSISNPAKPNNINFSSSVTSLSIAGTMNAWTGTLDIGNNGLVIAYGNLPDPYTTINNMVESGYNGGVWGGTGITSTLAQAGVTQHISTPLNIGLLDFTPGTGNYSNTTFIVFEGQTVTTNAILVRLTYMDDLVLAGDMASNNATSDALLFAANYGTGTTWGVGDLVHSGGPIDSSDALLFAANYVVGLPSLDGTSGGNVALGSNEAAVPEPASLGLLAIGAIGLLAIRGARKRKPLPAAQESTATQ